MLSISITYQKQSLYTNTTADDREFVCLRSDICRRNQKECKFLPEKLIFLIAYGIWGSSIKVILQTIVGTYYILYYYVLFYIACYITEVYRFNLRG